MVDKKEKKLISLLSFQAYLNWNFALILGYLNPALNKPSPSLLAENC